MSSALLSAAASFRQALAGFEPGLLSAESCARVAEELAATEKACAAARLLAAARAVGCGAHQGRGFSDGAAWMARQVGGAAGQARQALEAAAGLEGCPGTRSAVLAGEVSLAQAAEITRAETGVPFVNRLEVAAQRARRAGQHGGGRERFEAYAADALAAMAVGEGPARSARADLVVVCDLFAWRRGHGHPGEVCHIVDGGPVPVELAHELGKDAFIKAVLHDGVAVHTIKHFGRHLPAELRSALDLGDVPTFQGAKCADCARRYGLEYDHVNPVANHGPTSYANLEPRCWADHQAKTERDRQAGLLGPGPPALASPGPRSRTRALAMSEGLQASW